MKETDTLERSEKKKAIDIAQIYNAIVMLSNDSNLWPGQQPIDSVNTTGINEICADGCNFSLSDPHSGIVATDGNFPGWAGPYMDMIPDDSWGNKYFFDTDYQVDINNKPCACGGGGCTNVVVIGSYGPDGIGNNQYNCDDIIKIITR